MKVLIIDNYDSFTFNLFQYCGEILDKKVSSANQITVKRNNQISLNDLQLSNPDKIIISPGPGSPEQKKYFGICQEIILKFGSKIPILGICQGMQMMGIKFGSKLVKVKNHIRKNHKLINLSKEKFPKKTNSYHQYSLKSCPKNFFITTK